MMRRMVFCSAMLLCLFGCKGDEDHDDGGHVDTPLPLVPGEWGATAGGSGSGGTAGTTGTTGGGTTGGGTGGGSGASTTDPVVDNTSSPPASVTWHIGFTENVPQTDMEDFYQVLLQVNEDIWQISEGQVSVGHFEFWDNVGPGTQSNQMSTVDTSNLDMVVWPDANWAGPGAGYVIYGGGFGRIGRCIGVPVSAGTGTLTHEGSHFLWVLTWSAGPGLTDEYASAPQDSACVMELAWSPLRWCWLDNHLTQASQPTSCWEQILMDYPNYAYANSNSASGSAPTATVTYNDVP